MPSYTSDGIGLELDFVYGYHGSRCRDNLFYTDTQEIVYHIAGVGIVYNPKTHKQRFFLGHTDDIISLTMHPNKHFVATGQIGRDPFIVVWDTRTMATVAFLKNFHQRGICSLGFSNDGKYLVSVGLDNGHTMALWDWENGRVVASASASKERIFDIEPSPYTNLIVTCGVKHINFWRYSGNSLISKRGLFGKVGEIQTILCIGFGHNDGKTYTGTLTGDVYIWEDNKLVQSVKAHKGPVYSVTEFSDGYLTGGKDSTLRLWSKEFKPLYSIPMGKYNLRSLDFDNGRILVGTKSSDIIEVIPDKDMPSKTLLIEGHGEGELWGLGMGSCSNSFVTASDDKQVKLWDSKAHKCIGTIATQVEARSCSFSPDEKSIAVGFKDGSWRVYSAKSLKEVIHVKDRKEEISQIKYSPDGLYLAVSSHDNFVDIYDTNTFKKISSCIGATSFVTHLDWSTDSKHIRINTGDYEILIFDVQSGKQNTSRLNVEWASFTGVLGEEVAGIWPEYSDNTDVNCLDRKNNYIVTGDDFGFVKLFPFPCPKGSPYRKYIGHSAHVTNVKWSPQGDFVVSTGGGDQAVMQWRVVTGYEDNNEGLHDAEEYDSDLEREKEIDYSDTRKEKVKPVERKNPPAPLGGPFTLSSNSESVKAGRPLLKFKPPTGHPLNGFVESQEKPTKELTLDFIYGYRGFDTRHNVFYNADDKVVYHTAACGIVLDKDRGTQQFFRGHHDDDIICMALHPGGTIVATGQIGKDPKIIVWDSTTLEKLSVLSGFHQRGVCSVGFSGDGNTLVSVGLDDKHTIALWNWRKGVKIASGPGSQEKIMIAMFHPSQKDLFVSCGIKHANFWTAAGNGLVSKKGVFGKVGEIQTMLCVSFDGDRTVMGSNSGQVYIWKGNNLEKVIEAHKGPIFDICKSNDGFVTGGKDSVVKFWDNNLREKKAVNMKEQSNSAVRSVYWANNNVLVGMSSGAIFEIDSNFSVHSLMEGHGMGELWGLATHPSKNIFVTASDDKTVRVWDMDKRKQLAYFTTAVAVRSAAYSPDGSLIAVGFINGSFSVYSSDLKELYHFKHRKEEISDLKYSPNGKYLAVGSHDNFVDIYGTSNYERVGRCSGNSSFITHLDWAKDSELLMTNSGDYQQLFFKAPKGNRVNINTKQVPSMEWATWTGVLGEHIAGIWSKYSDGTDINAVDRSKAGDVLATGDDFGYVKLFQYPCPLGAKAVKAEGHSAHVTNVKFSYNDQYLISTGGGDTSIFQWRYGDTQLVNGAVDDEEYDSDVEKEKQLSYVSREELAEASEPSLEDDAILTKAAGGGLFQLGGGGDVVKAAPPRKKFEYHDEELHEDMKIPSLQLEYVHGYRAHDTRNNLFYTKSGEIVYHSAAVGIVMDTRSNTQKFFLDHTDDIVSLAYHKESDFVATGQVGKKPRICVWSPTTMKVQSVIQGEHLIAVCALDFSACGKLLASVDETNEHIVVVWEWKDGMKIATGRASKDKVFDLTWNRFTEDSFVTVGVKHIKFWKVTGNALSEQKGVFGQKGSMQTLLCATFTDKENCYTGAVSGEIYHWIGNKLNRVIKAHAGATYSINPIGNNQFASGGKDDNVFVWGSDFSKPKRIIALPGNPSRKSARVRSISGDNGKMIVGTFTSEIFEIENANVTTLISAHGEGELWGLATDSRKDTFVTAGDDSTVRMWDVASRKLISMAQLPLPARSVALAPDGSMVAVGLNNGTVSASITYLTNPVYRVGFVFEAGKSQEEAQKGSYSRNQILSGWTVPGCWVTR